jgi:hypothetical protein
MAKCQASCSGSCTAQANVNCNVSCQAMGYANCEAMLSGGCTAQCMTPQGALFCDGNYVDTGNNLQNCIDELKSALNITVMASASGNCSGNQCMGQAQASASCIASDVGSGASGTGGLLFAGAGIGLVAFARRTRRR